MRRLATAFMLALLTALGGALLPTVASEKKKCPLETQECLDYMARMYRGRGWMGVELDVDEETGAYVISHVFHGGPADKAGILKGDILRAANGIKLNQREQEAGKKVWQEMKPGKIFHYTFERDGRELEVDIKLVKMPDYIIARQIGLHMIEHAHVPPEE